MPNKYEEETPGIGFLWVKSGKRGPYLSGKIEFTHNTIPLKMQIVIFRNRRKASEKDPDYRVKVLDVDHSEGRRLYHEG
jgi:hypothetical protein